MTTNPCSPQLLPVAFLKFMRNLSFMLVVLDTAILSRVNAMFVFSSIVSDAFHRLRGRLLVLKCYGSCRYQAGTPRETLRCRKPSLTLLCWDPLMLLFCPAWWKGALVPSTLQQSIDTFDRSEYMDLYSAAMVLSFFPSYVTWITLLPRWMARCHHWRPTLHGHTSLGSSGRNGT